MPLQSEGLVSDQPTEVGGVRLGTAAAGIRYQGRDDLVLVELDPGATGAGVFTRNAFCAAPVEVARRHLGSNRPRLLLINSGNANAGTGARGLADAETTCEVAATRAGCSPEEVLPFSTGVIGEHLPMDRYLAALPAAYGELASDGWLRAAKAILTTDTRPKLASMRLSIGGRPITLTGMAKGAGMICPDMATMLAFLTTDASVSGALLQRCLDTAVAESFNAITVDGDTSTNDACVLLATGAAGGTALDSDVEALRTFQDALNELCGFLAKELVRDAEGATRLVTVEVEQGRDREECRQVAYTVAHSPLVKTALYAADANWGRILAAVGRAGLQDLDIAKVSIFLGEVCVVRCGELDPAYLDARGQAALAGSEVTVRVVLGRGQAKGRIWTSDLSHEYVTINAEYRS